MHHKSLKPSFAHVLKKHWMEPVAPFLMMCLLFGVFAIALPNYLSIVNLQQLMRDFAELGLVTIAMAIVILAGGIDLSVDATFALANFAALFLFRIHGLPLRWRCQAPWRSD